MRVEAGIALSISTVFHAGIIFVAPDMPGAHGLAGMIAAPPQVITAQLKNTLDDEAAPVFNPLQSRQETRSKDGNSAAAAPPRPERVAKTVTREQRIDSILRFYPQDAIRQGLEGEAIVMLRIGGDGEVLAAEIAKSSGHVILDEAALRAVRATTRFPPGSREILFPVTFALR